jgi:glycosyltransferase involved in cell wall biosynthesis
MKIVITHTDLRIYWPSRIAALQQALESSGDELYTIEIAGAGSPYAFAENGTPHSSKVKNWICLFPATRMEDLTPSRASGKLLAKLKELNPDVVMAGSIAYPSGATAVYWAKKNRKPVIIFDDVRPEDVPRNPLVDYIKRLIYGQVEAVLCPAASWTDAFRHWNFRPEQLFFGVDVVDNGFWSTADPYGPPPDGMTEWPPPFLLVAGRQIPAKNLCFLLQAYESYRVMTGENCLPLVMIGEGPERKMIEDHIRSTDLKGVYLFPFVNPEELRAFYQHAAALVLPSSSETWGLVVNEAMAAGLPVLVSKACGCASVLVKEEVNGYTFHPDRLDQLVAVFLSFTNKDAARRASMGEASRQIIRSWGLDQFVKGSLQAIYYAMKNKKTRRSITSRFVLQHWKGRYRPV